jgi:hypothetical protein
MEPALMRQTLTCPQCGGGVVLRVRPVREWNLGLEEMAVVRSEDGSLVLGTFELDACPACGHVEWLARGLEGLEARLAARPWSRAEVAQVQTTPCPGCGQLQGWRIGTMREVGGGILDPIPMGLRPRFLYGAIVVDDPIGRVQAEVCTGCGLTGWRVRGLAGETIGARAQARCRACDGGEALLISPLHDMASWSPKGQPRRVAFHRHWLLGRTGRGHFDGQICTRCFRLEWRARDIADLTDDPESGVERLVRPDPSTSGPYR